MIKYKIDGIEVTFNPETREAIFEFEGASYKKIGLNHISAYAAELHLIALARATIMNIRGYTVTKMMEIPKEEFVGIHKRFEPQKMQD